MNFKNWLFLRGEYDKNNQKCHKDNSDVWLQLARELSPGVDIWYKGWMVNQVKYDYIFARGGHPYYNIVLKNQPTAFKIYYGSGIRFCPDKKIKYDLILVDNEEQYKIVERHHPNTKISKWFKPAANHFQVIPSIKKEFDICFVARCKSRFQEKIKRVKWFYKNLPEHYKVLHIGDSNGITPPKNVTIVRGVSKLDMPRYINQCKVGVIPYKAYDSTPRVLPEMLACGLPVVTLEVPYWDFMYNPLKTWTDRATKKNIWDKVDDALYGPTTPDIVRKDYNNYISMERCVEHLRRLIDG